MLKIVNDSSNNMGTVWGDFVLAHPHGNVFQTPEMHEVYLQTKKYEPIIITTVDDNDDIMGVLLAVIQKEYSGILGYFSARSIIWGGPLVKDNNLEISDFILKEYKKRIKGKAIYTQFRNLWDWRKEGKGIFIKNGYDYEDHLDILIDLRKSADELLMEMHKGRRKNIGRAERVPVEFMEIENASDYDKCLKLIEDTYKRVKLPCPQRSFFYNANKLINNKCRLKKFVAKYQNEIISCRFALCYKGLVYDWFAGTDEKHQDKYPNDFLIWNILRWAKENNYSAFDFGGAGKPNIPYGVRDYKIKFGGELVNFGRFELIHNWLLYKIGIIGISIYKAMIRYNKFFTYPFSHSI
jgi:serine/alanine adding enzyme